MKSKWSFILSLLLFQCYSILSQQEEFMFSINRHVNGDTFNPPGVEDCSTVKGSIEINGDGDCQCNENQTTVHFHVDVNSNETTLECFDSEHICPDCHYGGVISFTESSFTFNRSQLFHDVPSSCIPKMSLHAYFLGLWFQPDEVIFNRTAIEDDSSLIVEANVNNSLVDFSGGLVYISIHCEESNQMFHVLYKVNGTGFYPSCTINKFCNEDMHVVPKQSLQTTTAATVATTSTTTSETSTDIKIMLERIDTGDKLLNVSNCSNYQGALKNGDGTCQCGSDTPTFHFKWNGANETLGCFKDKDICTDCLYIGMSSLMRSNNKQYILIHDDLTRHFDTAQCKEINSTRLYQYVYGYWFWEKVEFNGFTTPQTKILSNIADDAGLIIRLEVSCLNSSKIFNYVSKLYGQYYYIPGANQNVEFEMYILKSIPTTTAATKPTTSLSKTTTTIKESNITNNMTVPTATPVNTSITTTASTESKINTTAGPLTLPVSKTTIATTETTESNNITTAAPVTFPDEKPILVTRYLDGDIIYIRNFSDCYEIKDATSIPESVCYCDWYKPTLHFDENKTLGCYENENICEDCQYLGLVWLETPLKIVIPNKSSNIVKACKNNITSTRLLSYSTFGFWPYHEVKFDGFKSGLTKIESRFPIEGGALMRLEVSCSDNMTYKYMFKINGTFWYTEEFLSSEELHIDSLVPPEEHITATADTATTTTTSSTTTTIKPTTSTTSPTITFPPTTQHQSSPTATKMLTIGKKMLEITTKSFGADRTSQNEANGYSANENNFQQAEEILIPLIAVVFIVALSSITLFWYRKKFRYPRSFAMHSISIKTVYTEP